MRRSGRGRGVREESRRGDDIVKRTGKEYELGIYMYFREGDRVSGRPVRKRLK